MTEEEVLMANQLCVAVVPAPAELSLFTAMTMIVIGIIASSGNLGVVTTILKDPLNELHTPFNYLLLNLALSDLLLGAAGMPFGVALHIEEYFKKMEYDMKLVQTFHMTVLISATASLLSLIALSIERLIAITYTSSHRSVFTFQRCLLLCAGIWLFSVSIPNLYFATDYIGYIMFFMHVAIALALVIIVIVQYRIKVFLRIHTKKNYKRHVSICATSISNSIRRERITLPKEDIENVHMCPRILRGYIHSSSDNDIHPPFLHQL